MLIKIGDFAREAGVTVKTLRHYEKLGLLKPAWVNRFNSYRYYAPEQFERLDMLLAYKDAGFSLAQIGILMDARTTESEYQVMLAAQCSILEIKALNERKRADLIASCLERMQQGELRADIERSLTDHKHPEKIIKLEEIMDIPIKHLPALKLTGMRYQGKNEHNEIANAWTTFNRRSQEIKNNTGEAAYGVCFIPEGLAEGEFAYLCALPVSEITDIPQGMDSLELEPMQAAVFEHRGAYETLGKTYASIYQKWLPEAGLKPLKKGLDMEVYTGAFKDFAPDSLMYIYVPIQASHNSG